ncbi:hypothetical protein AURDEDRAFT_173695 [Auricularia subglabra TFB-10046 SS5]|nr:hypothetical protein AURDEDRAFT_173695 [Auricularia subglabra TFB-10046 SS5]
MLPKLMASSPKTRRQRAALTRQLRSRTSTGSSSSIVPSAAKAKRTTPALKKAIPLCKMCTAGGRALYHYWTQCPKKKEKTGASGKAIQGKKSARTLATNARHAALLAQLSDVTAELATRPDDAMSVDSVETMSDASKTDSEDDARASDVSMAGAVCDEADTSASDDDDPVADAPVPVSEFFSDSEEASDSEAIRAAAQSHDGESDNDETDEGNDSAAASDGADASDDDDHDCTSADDESDGNGTSAGSAARSDGEASDDGSSSSGEWDGEEIGVAELIAYASDGTAAGGDESGPEEHTNDSDDEDASQSGSDEDEAPADYARGGDAEGAEEEESGQEDDSDDATGDGDSDGAIDTPNGEYFNQAVHVGRIDSDDDMDSETRIAKLHQAVEDKGDSQRAIELHEELENPSPEKVQEQKALLAEVTGAPPVSGPADGDAAANRRAALRAMLSQSVDQREALEAGSSGSSVIMNGWKGNSAEGKSIVYKRNTAQRWARVTLPKRPILPFQNALTILLKRS